MIDSLPAPLAAALAAKGYDTLTAVQEAVLAPTAAGRDLLVSAQTGSGKTVAFGLSIAPELLGTGTAGETEGGQAAGGAGGRPRALIVAPTRELALQVRREFEWLYAGAGLEVASCVGGMDFRTERRALERGAALVVGTPGRLRDHIERGTLDLGGTAAVVLDEADEMLDLGFREDLEFILSAAAAERRTLMFSATVPKAIEELATTYQRDALRVVAAGEARQHGDIAYRALSTGPRDKEKAILNLLRLHEARLAIVFCKTRAAVAHLAARMGNRGLAVVALSGELGQAERTRALQSLRDGRAKVCVATDVAARGLDLPGLDLVVHADLPSNPDTLLHRSGRTGRAGQKGVSVLVVAPSEYRKAQRLLALAKVQAEWGKPPSADDVQAADDARLMADGVLATPVQTEEAAMVGALIRDHGAEALAAAVLRLWRGGRSAPEVLEDDALSAPAPSAPPPREGRPEFGPAVWFSLSAGFEDRAEARWILPKLCESGSFGKEMVGAIRVRPNETFVQVAAAVADRLGERRELDGGLVLTRLEGDPTAQDAGAPADRAPGRAGRPSERPERPRGPRPEARGAGESPYPPRKRPDEGQGEARRWPTPRDGARWEGKRSAPEADGPATTERKARAPRPSPLEPEPKRSWTDRKPSDRALQSRQAPSADAAPEWRKPRHGKPTPEAGAAPAERGPKPFAGRPKPREDGPAFRQPGGKAAGWGGKRFQSEKDGTPRSGSLRDQAPPGDARDTRGGDTRPRGGGWGKKPEGAGRPSGPKPFRDSERPQGERKPRARPASAPAPAPAPVPPDARDPGQSLRRARPGSRAPDRAGFKPGGGGAPKRGPKGPGPGGKPRKG
jgi:ATP-dependent RNA helicase DeaD